MSLKKSVIFFSSLLKLGCFYRISKNSYRISIHLEGSSGGEIVRVTALLSRGPEYKSTWHQGFFFSSSFSINGTVSLIRSLKRGAFLLFFLFPIVPLAVLPEAKQAKIYTECGFKKSIHLNIHCCALFGRLYVPKLCFSQN